MLISGESFTSDNPYIMGIGAGTIVGSALFMALTCEQFFGRRAAAWVYGAFCGLLLSGTFLLLATAKGEAAEGVGLILTMVIGSGIGAMGELFLLRRLRPRYFWLVDSALAIATVIMLWVTPVR